ncbi:tol-pal system-associated acyl-CoA thioesterase [Sodalis ligni]|uniref:Biopolymer transport protein ExbB n=1 Tax=Sodalis ligni TaxID=2697027 RepID=A0A4R1NB68_9GAMM|nr:tol-pal system-associated acyl-CoA thioesterase [Sodalis ligni]TCL04684.1 outer membrane transport energization protein ExbB [Sodalis ligni]
MKTAVMTIIQDLSFKARRCAGPLPAILRGLAAASLFSCALSAAAPPQAAAQDPGAQNVQQAPSQDAALDQNIQRTPAFSGPLSTDMGSAQQLAQMDLSVWGMYRHADVVVKTVLVGLLIASIITWALFFGKGIELMSAKRRLRYELRTLKNVRSLDEAIETVAAFRTEGVSSRLVAEVQNELDLSAGTNDSAGIKERAAFRLERRVAAASRMMGKGNGFLATIGAISPFIGLFGTVWGIMNSFIGIAHTQTTNLAVVAPGIAEALLATAVGLFAAIPAVVIYNIFARTIAGYKAMVGDSAAQILLLLGRDLDLAAGAGNREHKAVAKLRLG